MQNGGKWITFFLLLQNCFHLLTSLLVIPMPMMERHFSMRPWTGISGLMKCVVLQASGLLKPVIIIFALPAINEWEIVEAAQPALHRVHDQPEASRVVELKQVMADLNMDPKQFTPNSTRSVISRPMRPSAP